MVDFRPCIALIPFQPHRTLCISMEVQKILVADNVSPLGVEKLNAFQGLEAEVRTGLSEDELVEIIPEYSALIVRSATKVTARVLEAGTKLKAVGRAGVGVDNIDIEAATQHGVIVMNTPEGNTISTAEHAFSLMMSTARMIPQAHSSVSERKWERKKFVGVELNGKCLAVLGMGRIGTEVARRALAFGMRVCAYDPYLSASRARSLQVELFEELDALLGEADFITLHMPLTAETRHIIDERRIGLLKDGVRIINCARGGLVDEKALAMGLESGKVGGAALDVYENEPPDDSFPLWDRPQMVFTPHLGASTEDAQESVGIEVAEVIAAVLLDGTIKNAVNAPSIDSKTLKVIGPYLDFARVLGRMLSQVAPPRCEDITINYTGKVSSVDTKAVTRSMLFGYLERMGDDRINVINAQTFADKLGIQTTETRRESDSDFTDLMEVSARSGDELWTIAGTFFGAQPRIVMINGRHVEAWPEGYILLLENRDTPGIIGSFGSKLGQHGVNIARMSLSRHAVGGMALTVLNIDSEPPAEVLEELRQLENIVSVKLISL